MYQFTQVKNIAYLLREAEQHLAVIIGFTIEEPIYSFLDEISGSQTEYIGTGLGVQVPLRTGGRINFDLADNRIKTGSIYSVFDPSYSSDMSLSISQPLLRNAGKRTTTYAIRIAEYERQITDAITKLEVIRIIAAVDRVYWYLYAARRELEVRKQQYDLAKALYEQALRFVDAGDKPQVEVIRTEAGVAQQLEAIIIAENNVRVQERDLKRTLNKAGLEMQTPTVLIPATEPDPMRYELQRKQLVATAMEHRMDMLELELQIAEDVAAVAAFVKDLPGSRRYELLPYHGFGGPKYRQLGWEYPLGDLEPPTEEQMTRLQELTGTD